MEFKISALILLSSAFLIAGCSNDSVTPEPKSEIKQVTPDAQKAEENQVKILNYRQFEKLFEHMHTNLKIDSFQLKASTLGPDVTIIDRELSFDKRDWLTVDGTADGINVKSTQESLYFEDKEQTTLLSINFAYTDRYIGEDMIQYQISSGYKQLNQEISNRSDLIIISYRNILISVQQSKSSKVNIETTQLAVKNVIKELEKNSI